MTLPITPNTTCDVYRKINAPPAAPDVAAVSCYLQADWRGGLETSERDPLLTWTHVMLINVSIDIRDAYGGQGVTGAEDKVYVPDQNGTSFKVMFIERVQRGTAHEHKRVYLDRLKPTWPTNEL